MGGRKITSSAEKIGSIQLQSSAYGLGLPIRYGTNRGSGNLIWFGNFRALPHTEKTKAGKGLGSVKQENTTYTYTAAVMMALGEGPIAGIGKVWKGKESSSLSALGLTLLPGNSGQAPWSFISSYSIPENWDYEVNYGYQDADPSFVNQALGYDTTAILAASDYDLGSDASIPNHGFEIKGQLILSGKDDCNMRLVIEDFLSSPQYGVGFSAGMIGNYDLYEDYVLSLGLLMSPPVEDTKAASAYLTEWLEATNTDALWSDGVLKLLPRGDVSASGNGSTFTPDLTPIYDLDDDAFLEDDPPVRVTRKTPADAYNRLQLEFRNRLNEYNDQVVTVEDQNAIEQFGLRTAPKISAPFITDPDVAMTVAQLILQRLLYLRNTFSFGLTDAYALLEPGDLVTISDPDESMERLLVRLTSIEESDDGFDVEAEDMLIGVANAALYPPDTALRYLQNINTPPNEPPEDPFIFELPADPTTTGLAVGIATGRKDGDVLYGGCNVWMSFDGESYSQVGSINGSSRFGTLRSAFDDTDTTMEIEMLSGRQMPSVSPDGALNAVTLIAVGEEYLAYETSDLVAEDQYDLSDLVRGMYETVPADHSSGAKWARVDDAICKVSDLDLSLIGQTIYIKLTAFNTYEGGETELDEATEYSYTITGYMEERGKKAQLDKIGQDGWLHPTEKLTVIREFTILTNEKSGLDAQADARGVSRTAYDNAYSALSTYLNGLSPDYDDTSQATAVVRATWNTKWNDLYVAKQALINSLTNGVNTAIVYAYQRAASTPSLPSASTTYTFATTSLTGLNNGWTTSIPTADGNPLYVTAASAVGTGPTDTIGSGEWASAVIMAEDGGDGAAGLNSATVLLYQRNASTPSVPSTSSTYTFSTAGLTGFNNGWSQTIPSGTDPIWVTTATAISTSSTDSIGSGEWATPRILAENGVAGANGLNNASILVYQRASSSPTLPSASTTYTFATAVLTGLNNGWSQTLPAHDGNPLWVTAATASSATATDNIGSGEWASAVKLTEDGAAGSNGNPGPVVASVILYQRAVSSPSVPGSTTTFTFATGILSGTLGSWSQSVPAHDGNPLWVTTATALGTASTSTDSIGSGEWASPQIIAQDGATGADGTSALTITCSPPLISVPCTFNGTPKSSVPGFQIKVDQDGSDVSASATYGSITSSGITGASVDSDGTVTVTGMSADTGYVEIPISHGGANGTARVEYAKMRDGNAAVSGSASITGLANDGTYVTSANFNVTLADGQTFNISANCTYFATTNYIGQCKLAYQNVTDAGSETDISGTEVTGDEAFATEPAVMNTSGSVTNSTGGTKVFNIRFKSRQAGGSGDDASVTGSVGGSAA